MGDRCFQYTEYRSGGTLTEIIRNRNDLIKGSPKTQHARKLALDLIETALAAADPQQMVRQVIKLDNHLLQLVQHTFNLHDFNGFYVIGAGKATGRMAEAIERLLPDNITSGLIVVPENTVNDYTLQRVKILGGGHPLPTDQSVTSTQALLEFITSCPSDALMISLISGGGSSLLSLPAPPLTVQDLQQTTTILMESGVPITDMNTLRKHLSQVKGGNLSRQIHPRKHLSLLISDIPNDQLDMIASGPTLPDPTTFDDAADILTKYNLWSEVPPRVKQHIETGVRGDIADTPKPTNPIFASMITELIGSNRVVCEAAQQVAQQLGLTAQIVATDWQGEAREIGLKIGELAARLPNTDSPQVVIIGSETTVTVHHPGKGGRNTELIAATLPFLKYHDGLVVASLATDGIDGPTPYAGGVADNESLERATNLNLSPEDLLDTNNTFTLFEALNDHIFTGPTHTNVRDITIIVYFKDPHS
jgi:glycerate 2-kinase